MVPQQISTKTEAGNSKEIIKTVEIPSKPGTTTKH
uniref:Uncharacterized protein n=1 Tax=Rhizophora mucronata TaxID=61149 RepID=A0A2P2N4E8_RHIMU